MYNLTNKFERYSLWIALIIHLLLLLFFSVQFAPVVKIPIQPIQYVPSYFYDEENKSLSVTQHSTTKNIPVSKNGIKKPATSNNNVQSDSITQSQSQSQENTQAVHLVGKTKLDKPLIAILGKAITAHMDYPKIAMDFNLKGTSYVRFILHPDGRVTNVELIKSSTADLLDDAALAAINAISPVSNVSQYVTKPEVVVFGIIFN